VGPACGAPPTRTGLQDRRRARGGGPGPDRHRHRTRLASRRALHPQQMRHSCFPRGPSSHPHERRGSNSSVEAPLDSDMQNTASNDNGRGRTRAKRAQESSARLRWSWTGGRHAPVAVVCPRTPRAASGSLDDIAANNQLGPTHFTGFGGYTQPSLLAFDPEDPRIVVAAAAIPASSSPVTRAPRVERPDRPDRLGRVRHTAPPPAVVRLPRPRAGPRVERLIGTQGRGA